jgi:hypothetical protein
MTIVTPDILANQPSYNEAAVRLFVIDPVLRKLGYLDGGDVYVKPEEKLEYPYYFIGHKSKKKDLPIGYPDYRVGLKGGRGSFIVEAKAAPVGLSQKDVEQAHSYAAHAQVGANYFVLCDGAQIVVYETLSGPQCMPIVVISIDELDDRFYELENVLSPASLAKNSLVSYDTKLKLCDGLGSSVKIHSGEYNMDDWAYRILIDDTDCTEMMKSSVPEIADIDSQLEMMEREFELRVRTHSQNNTIAARAMAERKISGHLS